MSRDAAPEIADYGFLADGHAAALVSRHASIDWCCLPRIDSDSCFGRLLDWQRGGHFSIFPAAGEVAIERHYLESSLVLETRFATAGGEARLVDGFAMRPGGREAPFRQLFRVVEGCRGRVRFAVDIVARFDYGACRPWARRHGERLYSLIGGDDLAGYRDSRPVRIGNAAHRQLQLDVYGELLDLAWRSARRGRAPDDAYWRFLTTLADEVARRWREPDSGIWEMRSAPRHFVHSKAMCWAALDRALDLARRSGRAAGVEWRAQRDALRERVEREGVDPQSGRFVQAFGSREVDAALLQLPRAGFVDDRDPRMRRTVTAIRDELVAGGLVRRYRADDGIAGGEGTFVACTFWLAETLAKQGDLDAAAAFFERAAGTANDLGLFAEEFDAEAGLQLGNFPQALSHYSHLTAALALDAARRAAAG